MTIKTFTREEALNGALKYFNGNELSATVWVDKYCLKNGDTYFEDSPDLMHRRLASEFARIESNYSNPVSEEEIYELLKDFKYIVPQGSPMFGIGNGISISSLSNCFVIGDHTDSYGGIMRADEEQAQLMKRRGGVGQDIGHIRPSGTKAGASYLGPNAGMPLYMDRYSNTTREVQQDGRRGALMLSVPIEHPDSEKFIDKKMIPGSVTGANVSVKMSDAFMKSVAEGKDKFVQRFPLHLESMIIDPDGYDLNKLYETDFGYLKVIDPRAIWKKIIHNAWKSAEPGILFWDTILSESPASGYGNRWREKSTNPCGEIPLSTYDSCRLLAINLFSYVKNPFTDDAYVDTELFEKHVKIAQRLMDDLVDLEIEKIDRIILEIKSKLYDKSFQRVELELWQKIKESAIRGRRTGLGVLGEADLIAALGFTYGQSDATIVSRELHKFMATVAYESSIQLAEERGAFEDFDHNKESGGFLSRMFGRDNQYLDVKSLKRYECYGRRNIGILTIAPTGSTSMMTETTGGIEPLFAPYYWRKKKVNEHEESDYKDENGDRWKEFTVFHKPFIQWFSVLLDVDMEESVKILESYDKDKLDTVFKISPYYKATAQDVDYLEKVRMQGAVQQWIDHSISVTVNMPESVTEEMVEKVYLEAWRSGCKGITVYRENSRGNVLSTESIKNAANAEDFDYISALKRPKEVSCDVYHREVKGQHFLVLVGIIDNKPYEVFSVEKSSSIQVSRNVKKGSIVKKKRGCYEFVSDDGKYSIDNILDHMVENEMNSTRTISALLRHRVEPKYIVNDVIDKYATINSFQKVISRVLKEYVKADELIESCSECGGELIVQEGCSKCKDCGHSKCDK